MGINRLLRLVLVACTVLAPRDGAHAQGHYQADTWTVANGLPQNTVTGLTQDSDGYLWVATRKGLARFDGHLFRPMGVMDGVDLSTVRYTALVADQDGGVWAATDAADLIYLQRGRLRRFGPAEGVPPGVIWDLTRDGTGRIWMAASSGARYFSEDRWVPAPVPDDFIDSTNTVFVDSTKRVWIGSSRRGAIRIDAAGTRAFGADDGLPVARVFSFVEDRQGVLWAATPMGLARFDEPTQRFEQVDALRNVAVYQLLVDRSGTLWVATYGQGLLRYDPAATPSVSRAEGVTEDFILSLLEDRNGTIWVGTVSGGITRLVPVERQLIDARAGLPNFPVTTVYEDWRGTMWIGTLGGGLVSINGPTMQRYTTAEGLPSNSITSVAGGPDRTLWIGTSGQAAFRFRDGSVVERFSPEVTGSIVRTVEHHGNLTYFGGKGLTRVGPGGEVTRWTTEDGLGSNDIRVLYATPRGLYIGTYGGGVSRLGPDGTLTTWGVREGLSNPFVTSIHIDASDTVWVGTYGGGLFRIREGTISNINDEQGLEDSVIFDIMEDRQHRLWLMMNEGIHVVTLSDANLVADGHADLLSGTFLGRAAGISGIDGTDGNQPQSWLARDGRIWFATTRGVMIVDPATVGPPTAPPAARVDRVDAGNVGTVPGTVPLSFTARDLVFAYSTPELLNGPRVRYQHRLMGYDATWSPATEERLASYTNLPPGAYRFEVRAQNSRGGRFGQPTPYVFNILPRYYETGWFLALMGALAVGTLLSAYTLRVRRLQQRERTLQQLVDTRTAALRHEMTERERAEQERRALDERVQQAQRLESLGVLAGGIAHDFNNLLVGVLGEAGLALLDIPPESRARTHLHRIEQAALQASKLTSQMLAYSGRGRFVQAPVDLAEIVRDTARLLSTLLGRQIVLDMDFPGDLPAVEGDPSQLRQVAMNLLTNASDAIGDRPGRIRIAAGTQQVDVSMAEASSAERDGPLAQGLYVWLTVEDNGTGMDEATAARIFEPFFSTKFTGRGLGLAAVQGIVRSHHGRIHVKSRQGEGTTFSLLLPAAARPAPTPIEARPPRGVMKGVVPRGITVLIVDDERTVRDVARAAFEIAGFTVETAETGEQALDDFRRAPDRFALVVLDLTLPGISGRRVFHELRATRPGVPILLTSGFSAEEAADLIAQPRAGFVAKPWRPQELVQHAHQLVAEQPQTP